MFEQKFKECEKSLYIIAFSYLHNSEDVKDCVQETALSALKAYKKLKDETLFKTWITRILINKCKDFIRKNRCTEELNDNLSLFCEIPERDMDIVKGILQLEKEAALYITLRFYNDMTFDEMAKALNQPVSTVKYRTKNALISLKNILEGDAK